MFLSGPTVFLVKDQNARQSYLRETPHFQSALVEFHLYLIEDLISMIYVSSFVWVVYFNIIKE